MQQQRGRPAQARPLIRGRAPRRGAPCVHASCGAAAARPGPVRCAHGRVEAPRRDCLLPACGAEPQPSDGRAAAAEGARLQSV